MIETVWVSDMSIILLVLLIILVILLIVLLRGKKPPRKDGLQDHAILIERDLMIEDMQKRFRPPPDRFW